MNAAPPAERRAASKPASASREARLALRPSKLTQASMEPRPSLPAWDRPTYSPDGGLA